MADSESLVIFCTEDEIVKMIAAKEISKEGYVLSLTQLFNVLLEHYGYDTYWPTNDVH